MTDKTPPKMLSESAMIRAMKDREDAKKEKEISHASRYAWLFAISLVLNIFLAWIAFCYFPVTEYMATANAAAVCKVKPLNTPHVHHSIATDFAVEAALGIYDYNYGNYQRSITGVTERYFTPEFRDVFMPVFFNSENLRRVINEYLTVIPGRDGKPAQIERDGPYKGTYVWRINVPLVVHYTSGKKDSMEKVLAIVDVIQVDPQVNVRGLAVDRIELKQML